MKPLCTCTVWVTKDRSLSDLKFQSHLQMLFLWSDFMFSQETSGVKYPYKLMRGTGLKTAYLSQIVIFGKLELSKIPTSPSVKICSKISRTILSILIFYEILFVQFLVIQGENLTLKWRNSVAQMFFFRSWHRWRARHDVYNKFNVHIIWNHVCFKVKYTNREKRGAWCIGIQERPQKHYVIILMFPWSDGLQTIIINRWSRIHVYYTR